MLSLRFEAKDIVVFRDAQEITIEHKESWIEISLDGERTPYLIGKNYKEGCEAGQLFHCAYIMNETGKTIEAIRSEDSKSPLMVVR